MTTVTAGRATHQAARAHNSPWVERMARLGLLSRGMIWLTVGLLAFQVAVGHAAQADRQGALRKLAGEPFGHTLLIVAVAGFLGYGTWRLLHAVVGHAEETSAAKRWAKRFGSLCRGLLYLGFAVSTVGFLLHGSKGDKTTPLTARVMAHTGGQWLVGAIGVGVVVGGLAMAVTAARGKFMKRLHTGQVRWPRAVKAVGAVGLGGRGLVIALIGSFLVRAAVTYDARAAKGLDASLKSLAGQPYGRVLLVAAAVGLVAFALWSVAEAAWRKI